MAKGTFTCGILLLVGLLMSCETVKPYEKEYLLNPIMDDAKIGVLQGRYGPGSTKAREKLSMGGAGSQSSSCATCGG